MPLWEIIESNQNKYLTLNYAYEKNVTSKSLLSNFLFFYYKRKRPDQKKTRLFKFKKKLRVIQNSPVKT